MHLLQKAFRTVERGLETKQIGTPVAARVVAHVSADHGLIECLAAWLLEKAGQWFGSQPSELAASGSVQAGQITTLTRFAGGQSAVIATGTCGVGKPLLELTVFGNRGVLAWEDVDLAGVVIGPAEDMEFSEQARRMQDQIYRALESGQVLTFGETKKAAGESSPEPSTVPRSTSNRRLRAQKPPYGVLLVSGDFTHQPNYAEALTADGRGRLIGLTDEAGVTPRRRQANERMARRLQIPYLPNLDEALRREDVDIVSICAEPSRRGRIIVQAARAGKHLYLDKPLAGSLADADRIVEATDQHGIVDHMFSMIHTIDARRMQDVVRCGQLGELTALHFDLTFAKGQEGTARLGRSRQETADPQTYELPDSKRELTNVGVYPVVTLLWLLGRRVQRVFATTGNYFFREHQDNDMEDFGQMLLELDNGMTATISVGRCGWRSHPSFGFAKAYLAGSKEAVVIDRHRPRLAIWADVPPWSPPQRDPDDPMAMWSTPTAERYEPHPKQQWIAPPDDGVSDAEYFLDCIEQGRASEVPASLAAAATEILLAGYRSAASGQFVELPLSRKNVK